MSALRSRARLLVAALLVVPLLAVPLLGSPASAGTPYVVTLTASRTTVTYGGAVTLRGKVSPAADEQRVQVQRRIGSGAWTTITSPRLSGSSTYAVTTTPTKGRTSYRVVKAASRGHAADVSPVALVKAWRWRTLAGVAPVTSNDVRMGTFEQKGFTHGRGVALGDGGYVEWRVAAWRCTRVRAVVGVAGTSPDLTTFNAEMSWNEDGGDDLSDAEFSFRAYDSPRLFQMENRSAGVIADDTVLFEAYRVDGNPPSSSARLVFASPAVYCNS